MAISVLCAISILLFSLYIFTELRRLIKDKKYSRHIKDKSKMCKGGVFRRVLELKLGQVVYYLWKEGPLKVYILLDRLKGINGPLIQLKVSFVGISTVALNSEYHIRKAFGSADFNKSLNDRPESFIGKYLGYDNKGIFFRKSTTELYQVRRAMHSGLRLYGEGLSEFEEMTDRELCQLVNDLPHSVDVDPQCYIRRSMGNIVSIMLLGKKASHEDVELLWELALSANELLNPFYELVLMKLPFLRHVPIGPGILYKRAVESRQKFLARHFRTTQLFSKTDAGLLPALQCLRKKEEFAWITNSHITALVSDFVCGGLLTTTTAVLCSILILAHHGDCQKRLHREIEAISQDGRLPTLRDRKNMPYTQAFITELLRYISHIPIVLHSSSADVNFEGLTIPQGSLIFGNLWSVHHDEAVWGDPWCFRPERFLDNDGQLLSPNHPLRKSFLAFGTGRRGCVGETLGRSRLFLYIVKLLYNFDIEPPRDTPLADCDPRRYKGGAVLQPPGFCCRFIRRS